MSIEDRPTVTIMADYSCYIWLKHNDKEEGVGFCNPFYPNEDCVEGDVMISDHLTEEFDQWHQQFEQMPYENDRESLIISELPQECVNNKHIPLGTNNELTCLCKVDTPSFDWIAFDQHGIELTRQLKEEIGDLANVRYVVAWENPNEYNTNVIEFQG